MSRTVSGACAPVQPLVGRLLRYETQECDCPPSPNGKRLSRTITVHDLLSSEQCRRRRRGHGRRRSRCRCRCHGRRWFHPGRRPRLVYAPTPQPRGHRSSRTHRWLATAPTTPHRRPPFEVATTAPRAHRARRCASGRHAMSSLATRSPRTRIRIPPASQSSDHSLRAYWASSQCAPTFAPSIAVDGLNRPTTRFTGRARRPWK